MEHSSNSGHEIKNLIIEAVIINYDTLECCLFRGNGCTGNKTFNNCDFRVKLNNNKSADRVFMGGSYSRLQYVFNNCIFNLEHYLYNNVTKHIIVMQTHTDFIFNYCELNINLINLSNEFLQYSPSTSTTVNNVLFFNCLNSAASTNFTFKFCPIFININNNIKPEDGYYLLRLYAGYQEMFIMHNSYIVVKSKGKYKVPILLEDSGITCSGTSFYDSDISGDLIVYGATSSTIDNLYGLTTAQCKDPAYLESIGFFIAY